MTSTGQEWKELTLLPADTHASHSAPQAHVEATTTLNTYGRCSPSAFAWYDPDSHSWRTLQATFLSGSDLFSQIWPRSGMTQDGIAYQLPPSAPLTDATEYSSLLWTPTAKANYATPSMLVRRGNNGYASPNWVEWLMGFPIGWTDLED